MGFVRRVIVAVGALVCTWMGVGDCHAGAEWRVRG